MPGLIRLYLRSTAIGGGLACLFVALLLAFDVADFRHLLLGSATGLVGLFLLTFFHALLFSGVQFGIRVMLMSERTTRPPMGRKMRASDSGLPIAASVVQLSERSDRGRLSRQ